MPAVSVLMPCYNAAKTLDQALESLACQTLEDFEIIVVDDGSTDSTLEILRKWQISDQRIHILEGIHAGIIEALNSGLRVCRAPFVARMDADDHSRPERLARQVAFLDAHPQIDLVSCRVNGFPENQVREGFRIYIDWLNTLLSDNDIRREIFVESPLPHPSVVFRRKIVMGLDGYQDHGWAEDYDLWLRMYLAGARFAKLPEILLDWREHPQRLTRTDGRYSLENFLRAKAYYLSRGPLAGRDAVIVWGAGMVGRRLGRQLIRQGVRVLAFVDIDPDKIGRTRHGLPIIAPQELPDYWAGCQSPAILAAVGARGARGLIRQRLEAMGWREGIDWWSAA